MRTQNSHCTVLVCLCLLAASSEQSRPIVIPETRSSAISSPRARYEAFICFGKGCRVCNEVYLLLLFFANRSMLGAIPHSSPWCLKIYNSPVLEENFFESRNPTFLSFAISLHLVCLLVRRPRVDTVAALALETPQRLVQELYVTSSKRQKTTVSRTIVEQVRALDPPGRFLERDMLTGKYFDVGDRKAIEKTSQALRDGAAELRRQLSSIEGTADLATTDGSSSASSSVGGGAEPATPSPPSSPKGKGKAKCPQKKGRGTHATKSNSHSGTLRRRVSGSHSHHHSPCESFTPNQYHTPRSNQWYAPIPPRSMPAPLDRSYSVDHSWQTQSMRRSLSQPPLPWDRLDRAIPPPIWLTPERQPQPPPHPVPIMRAWSYDPRFAPATLADFTPPPSPARKRTCRPREIVPRPSIVVERADYLVDDPCDGYNANDDSPSMSPLPLYGDEGDADDSLIMDLSEDLLVIP